MKLKKIPVLGVITFAALMPSLFGRPLPPRHELSRPSIAYSSTIRHVREEPRAIAIVGGVMPFELLPAPTRRMFDCILWRESRSTESHLNLGDNNKNGSSGIVQIEQVTWAAHQLAAGVPLSVHVWQATPFQQEEVAVAIQKANGWGPWSANDGC